MGGSFSQTIQAGHETDAHIGAAPNSRRVAEIAAHARIGINGVTGLATDFLNQFNEAAMLLELVASDASLIADLSEWRPRGYHAHFESSGFADRHLALEAYELSPPLTRLRFETQCEAIVHLLVEGLAFLTDCQTAGAEGMIAPAAQALGTEVRKHLDGLNTLIHAGSQRPAQSQVDAMFAHRAA